MPKEVLKTLYNAHILPHLYYCSPIWCSTYPSHLLPLIRLQKRIIRIVTHSTFFQHTNPLFKETNILKLIDVNKTFIASYMYKHMHEDSFLHVQHNYPTRQRDNLRIPQHNTTLFKHSLAYMGPKIWTSIPNSIVNSSSLKYFKRSLKRYLIDTY